MKHTRSLSLRLIRCMSLGVWCAVVLGGSIGSGQSVPLSLASHVPRHASFQLPGLRSIADSSSSLSSLLTGNISNPMAFDFLVVPMPQSGSSKIVFASNRDGSMQIYSMNTDGTGQTRLTFSGANDDNPRWSPNGTKILFQSDRDHPETGYMDIYVMNSDGSGVTRLTTDVNDDSMAAWSPGGTKIVFQSMRNGVNYQVYSMNADGSNQVNLTNTSSSDGQPSCSPDGSKIVFASDRDHTGFDSVYVMNSDGANTQRITFSSGDVEDTQPIWSQDGSRIAFVSTRDSTVETWQEIDDDGNVITKTRLNINKEVYVMNADGSGQTRLTTELANDDSPSWSPDGSKIVFRSDRERDCCDPSAQVWTMNADGTGQVNISNSGNGDYSASWTSGNSSDSQLAGHTPPEGNQPPVANAGGSHVALTGQAVQFSAAASFDPDGSIIGYSWDFGDGSLGSGPNPTHQFSVDGVYSVWLSVCDNNGTWSSSQGFVTVAAVNLPARITFDELPNNTGVADQYLNQYGVRFSSANFFAPVHTYQNCGFCSTTSIPNFINTKPDDSGQTIVEFTQPVSKLTFQIIGVDAFFNPFAILDVYRNGTLSNTGTIFGNGTSTVGISLGSTDNISKIVIRGINDALGVGFDDFTFDVPSDVKITSGRVSGYLNGTTKNVLLGADTALQATPLPGAFAGGTYAWTCTPATLCPIITGANSSSVTLRANDLGNFTVTVSYTKSGVTASSSMTIKSILPSLTSFTAQQQPNFVWPPFTCGFAGEPTSLWWYRNGCHSSTPGIHFNAHVSVEPFISDPTKSGVKYVQAYSMFHKLMSRGIRCETRRSSELNVASGWGLDTEDPYNDDFLDFSGLLTAIGIDAADSPARAVTRFTDYEFVDALYVDDRAEMYLVYYSGNNPHNPPIQRPLGKYAWNWGGLVVFDWNGSDAVHRIRSTNPVLQSPPSTFPLQQFPAEQEVPCPDGSPFTDNRIDSSREFVKYHYIDFLGRDPSNPNNRRPEDPVGWNFWTSGISQCVFDLNCVHTMRIQTGLAFFYSGDFIATDPDLANPPGSPNFNPAVYNRAFVKWCYWKYLGRGPDLEGWDFWTRDLNNNGNYAHTVDAFQLCDDYRLHRSFE